MNHDDYDDDDPYLVLVKHEGVLGVVINYGLYVSTVAYYHNGLFFEEIMENEDFEPVEVDE